MQDLIDVIIVQGRRWWSFLSCLVRVFSHSCSVLYPKLVDCIDAKCLTEFQSRLGMVMPSPEVSFWFISLVIMCLLDSESYNKFWAVARILGLKSALNLVDSSTGLLEIVPRCRHAGLWEYPKVPGHWHAHNMIASRGKEVQKVSGTQGQDAWVVGMSPRGVVVDVEGMFDVFPSIPFL